MNDPASHQATLDAATRARDRLATAGSIGSLVGHEARNRLALVRAALELLDAGLEGNLSTEYRATLLREFNEFIDDFNLQVDMVRAEARPMEAIPAREAIEGIVESFRPRLSRGKIAIDIGFHHAADSIRADRRLLRLAILNLLRNAAEALEGREAPRIVLRTADEPRQLRVEISDNGPGVPPALVDRLFLEPSASGEYPAGLGLLLCRDALTLMGGSVRHLAAPGKPGACFRLTIPLA